MKYYTNSNALPAVAFISGAEDRELSQQKMNEFQSSDSANDSGIHDDSITIMEKSDDEDDDLELAQRGRHDSLDDTSELIIQLY